MKYVLRLPCWQIWVPVQCKPRGAQDKISLGGGPHLDQGTGDFSADRGLDDAVLNVADDPRARAQGDLAGGVNIAPYDPVDDDVGRDHPAFDDSGLTDRDGGLGRPIRAHPAEHVAIDVQPAG